MPLSLDGTTGISASGNITAAYLFGNASGLSGISSNKIFNGTSEANIGTSGGNANVSIGGTSNVAIFASTGLFVTGVTSTSGNVTGGNLVTAGLISATGNITGGNITTAGTINSGPLLVTGNVSVTGNIAVTGNINYSNVTDLVVGDPLIFLGANNTGNIYDLGFIITYDDGLDQHGGWVRDASDGTWKLFGNVVAEPTTTVNFTNAIYQPMRAGNVTAGNVLSSGVVSATGNITGNYILGNGSQLTGIDATSIQSGTSNVRVVSSGGNVSAGIGGTSNVMVLASTGQFITGLQSVTGNVTGGNILTAGQVSATGNITGAAITGTSLNLNTGSANLGGITNANGNGVGNIGNSTVYFNTAFVKATSAQYADLAENYLADAIYEPGTVVIFGGTKEVTRSISADDHRVAGVVSTNPSHLMNAGLIGDNVVALALQGRVPCHVSGFVARGDLLVSGPNGRAQANNQARAGTIIGKALQDFSGTEGIIEVAVGRD